MSLCIAQTFTRKPTSGLIKIDRIAVKDLFACRFRSFFLFQSVSQLSGVNVAIVVDRLAAVQQTNHVLFCVPVGQEQADRTVFTVPLRF